MNKVRYLIFHKDHPLNVRGVNSGAETATLWLARTLVSQGCEVIVAGQLPEGDMDLWGVTFWDLGEHYDVAKILKRARSWGDYHLIAACRALPIIASQEESNILSRHFIAHDPSGGATGINPAILSKLVDSMLCVSEAQKGLFVQAGADPHKINVVPNGADLSIFSAGEPEKRDSKRFVFVGALVAHKGIDILVSAFAHVAQKHPEAVLDVYGSASMWGQQPIFNENDITARFPQIRFHGAVSQAEVAKAFQTAAACIIPSRWFDSFPLTAVEALVTGCPVIAFDVGGIREAVTGNKTGLLIGDISEDALRAHLEHVIENPTLLKEMSAEALRSARPRFTWNNVVGEIRTICEGEKTTDTMVKKRIGLLSTWNQECGLATYAKYMMSAFEQGSYVVFGEEATVLDTDESFVTRCWKRGSADFSKLEKAIEESDIGVLQLNCHSRFFPQPEFSEFIKKIQGKGIKVAAIVHNLFTFEPPLRSLVESVDTVIVHSPENRLEAIANGAKPESVQIVPHGVYVRPALSDEDKRTLRAKLGIHDSHRMAVTFGFVQPHKGVEGLIEGVAHLARKGIPCTGVVAGKPNTDDPYSVEYQEKLKVFARDLGVSERIIFMDRFLSEDEVAEYLGCADIVLLNYRSQHYEASGACSLAVGAGATVITSIAPPFLPFHDAVFHATSGYPIPLAFEGVLTNDMLRGELRKRAAQYCKENSWAQIRTRLQQIYRSLGCIPTPKKEIVVNNKTETGKLRVLLHNRPTTFSQRGGDTVVIEKLLAGLKGSAVEVVVDLEAKEDPRNFDIVHIFNFAIPDMVRFYGERAKAAGKPFVVTTLLEDIPSFHYQSHYVAAILQEYIKCGQDQKWWNDNKPDFSKITPCDRFENGWSAQHAAALFTNGASESETVRRDYGASVSIREIPLGYDIGQPGDAEAFVREFGVRDFVLCVGRIESRKNQLMLLKALEHDDIPVVLAGGGFSYQPEYLEAVQSFKRKGRTIVLPRITDQQLANAYAAAKVHVLPSWYELPGLVSLEAAYYGCNVVATRRGTSYDYLGEDAFYCEPADPDSIRSAVLAGYYSPVRTDLKEKVMAHSWEETAKRTLQAYRELSGWKATETTEPIVAEEPKVVEMNVSSTNQSLTAEFQETLERGEILAKEGNLQEALEHFEKAESIQGTSGRIARAKGAVLLAMGNHREAQVCFEQAVAADSFDGKSYCGLGMCAVLADDRERGYGHFVKALSITPDHTVALFQLMESAYVLNRFDDLERVLQSYMRLHPEDTEMEFCLAGCLYKMNRHAEARVVADTILAKQPSHEGALELDKLLKQSAISTSIQSAIEKTTVPQARSDLSSVSNVFNAIDQKLIELEENKRNAEYEVVRAGVETVLGEALTPEQQESAQCLYAEICVLTDRIDDAEALYNEVLERNARCARALCGRGALAANRGDWSGAKAYFEEALSYRNEYDVALSGLGLCAAVDKNHEAAWNFYTRSRCSNQENVRALLGLIEMGYVLKRLPEVEIALKEYLDLHPADIDLMYSLAGCCYAQGKVDEAVEAISTITLFDPNHKHALELKMMIEQGAQPSA